MENKVDFTVENHGSVFLFQPMNKDAMQFLKENVSNEPWQWFGNALAVEHRYAEELANGLQSDGFTVS